MTRDPQAVTFLVDIDGRRASIELPMYEPQRDFGDIAQVMTADRVVASRDGIGLYTVAGIVRYLPDGWAPWWGSHQPCEGADALDAIAEWSAFQSARKRAPGQRGPALDAHRETLLAQALVNLAEGASLRAAVALAIEQDLDAAGKGDTDHALLQAVKRYRRGLP